MQRKQNLWLIIDDISINHSVALLPILQQFESGVTLNAAKLGCFLIWQEL